MAAPEGNQNAKKAKIWEQAIKRALARRANSTVDHGLDELADKIVAAAASGDAWALKEVGDRMDGKPTTVIAGDDELPPVQLGVIELVRPG
jgi:hypothetical protein